MSGYSTEFDVPEWAQRNPFWTPVVWQSRVSRWTIVLIPPAHIVEDVHIGYVRQDQVSAVNLALLLTRLSVQDPALLAAWRRVRTAQEVRVLPRHAVTPIERR